MGLLLVGWVAWFLFGRVTVYEVTEKGRLETQSTAHAVATPVGGQVVETRLTLGREVTAGEVLVVLDAEVERCARRERQAQLDALRTRLEALGDEIRAEQESLGVQRRARIAAVEEARHQVAQAEVRARLAEQQAETSRALLARRAISPEEYRRNKTEAEVQRVAVQALSLGAVRLEHDRLIQEGERKAHLAELDREAAGLAGGAEIETAAIARLDHEIALRLIRAPVSGRVGELTAEFQVGSVVRAAEKLGSIVPAGEPRLVALFPPAAVGRLRPGQPARLRLDGFPWTQYGTLPAVVTDAGNEASNGLIRVELALAASSASPIPLEHGLPGSVEVEVETVSPAILVLRAAGQLRARTYTPSQHGVDRSQL
jgi:membrane fusion protein (multidrug efflux system)